MSGEVGRKTEHVFICVPDGEFSYLVTHRNITLTIDEHRRKHALIASGRASTVTIFYDSQDDSDAALSAFLTWRTQHRSSSGDDQS